MAAIPSSHSWCKITRQNFIFCCIVTQCYCLRGALVIILLAFRHVFITVISLLTISTDLLTESFNNITFLIKIIDSVVAVLSDSGSWATGTRFHSHYWLDVDVAVCNICSIYIPNFAKNGEGQNSFLFLNCPSFLSQNYRITWKSIYSEATIGGIVWTKVLLKTSQNLQENTCSRVSFLIKFFCEFCKFLKNTSFTEHLRLSASFYGENLRHLMASSIVYKKAYLWPCQTFMEVFSGDIENACNFIKKRIL